MGFGSMIPICFILQLLFSVLQVQSAKPSPKCQQKPFYKILPMISNESAILNLDGIFDGYNLNFTLEGHQEWKNYIHLGEKRRLLKDEIPDNPLIGLRSYHLEKIGNSWGSYFVALRERNGRIYLTYGFLPSNTSAPVINNDIPIINRTDTTCFDAVSFPSQNLVIVDCVIKHEKDERGYIYTNKFYYYNINDGKYRAQFQNEMFIPFQSITRRKIQLYTEKASGNTYLLRSYMHDGVDELNQNNTYIDVHMMTDPIKPWVVSVIDRSFLRSSVLRAADLFVYLSEIYILDFSKGIHRVGINLQQQLVYHGFFQAKQFTNFAVYSNNLDDRFEIALANNHEILEIDWTTMDNPLLLSKYSLMPGSNVKQIFINYRFVVVFSSSSYPENRTDNMYNYTWILNRGARTYTKAFYVMKHGNMNTFIDFNLQYSYLLVIDDEKLSNYAIDEVILTMSLKKDEQFLDRIMKFNVTAKSIEPTSNESVGCTFIFNFTMVEDNNRTMWVVRELPPPLYHSNYPGKIMVEVNSYALGPNITYRITEVKKGQLKKYKVYQQDQLKINWEIKEPPLKDIKFLRTQAVSTEDSHLTLHIYTQDIENNTYLTSCIPNKKEPEILCSESFKLPPDGIINNWATSRFIHMQTLKEYHIAVYTTTKHYNLIIVDDVTQKTKLLDFEMGLGYAGNVTNAEVYGKYLFIIRRYVKSIGVFRLEDVVLGKIQPLCTITHLTMYNLGVKYFSPELIETSGFYPNVLFIKTSDTIIVLDLNTECEPKLLNVIKIIQNTTIVDFNFMLTLKNLIVIVVPNQIIEYDLSRIYLRDVKMTKKYPMYGYKLPKNYDTDASQYGNSIFVTTINEGGDYQVFIYRAGYPAVASLYDVIDLYTFNPILIDASGSFIDYVTVISGEEIRIFREYQIPVAEIFNPEESYQFWLQYYNTATAIKLQLITVSIVNLPTLIYVNPYLKDIMHTKDLLYSGTNRISQINDFKWFDGNVLEIKAVCPDCDNVVIVRNHIHKEANYGLIPKLVGYQWTNAGGTLLSNDTVLQMRHNGTVRDFNHLPGISFSSCLSTAVPLNSKYQVTACKQKYSINLYLISLVSHKGFAFAPHSSVAREMVKLEAVHELVILVDSSLNPFDKLRTGGILLFAVNFDVDNADPFEEIQYIDYNDFPKNDDKPEFVVNANLIYHSETQTYRLYITELHKGIYQFTFKFNRITRKMTLLQSYYINMPAHFAKSGYIPPYDLTYQSVKVAQSTYSPVLGESRDMVLLTTGVYHTVLLEIVYDASFRIIGENVKKFFVRYTFYEVGNQIKYSNGFIVLKQTLPQDFENASFIKNISKIKSKQLVSLYDINSQPFTPVPDGKIPEVGLIGASMIMDRNPVAFDFNLTYNTSDPHRVPRINLVVVNQNLNRIDQLSLHKNLTVFTKHMVDTQIIYLDLINDFDLKRIRILLNGYSPFPEWKLITIILFSIIGLVLLGRGSVEGYKMIKEYRERVKPTQEEKRESLVTEDRNSSQPKYQEYFGNYTPSYSYT